MEVLKPGEDVIFNFLDPLTKEDWESCRAPSGDIDVLSLQELLLARGLLKPEPGLVMEERFDVTKIISANDNCPVCNSTKTYKTETAASMKPLAIVCAACGAHTKL